MEVPDYIQEDYVLEFKGDSIIGVGILDGDMAICKKAEEPRTGQIVVAVARKDVSVILRGHIECFSQKYAEHF